MENKEKTGYPSIDKPWLKYYDKDAINAELPACSIFSYLYESNKNFPNDIAIKYFKAKISYKILFDEIESVCNSLANMGVEEGDIILLIALNTPETAFLFYAINKLGAVAYFVDPRLKDNEIKSIVEETAVRYIFSVDSQRDMDFLESNASNIEYCVYIDPFRSLDKLQQIVFGKNRRFSKTSSVRHQLSWSQFIEKGKGAKAKVADYEYGKPAVMVHTGGTTGKPKTVVLSNDSLNALVLNHKLCGYGFHRGDKFLDFLPPFYAYGVCGTLHLPLCLGFETVFLPKFDANDFPELMKKEKPDIVFGGPILYEKMMTDKATCHMDLGFFRFPISGGDTMSIELEKKINDYFARNGCKHKVGQGYGLTEVASSVCFAKEGTSPVGSVGIPHILNCIAIFEPDTDTEKGYGEEGEICIKSPTMMSGYYKNEEETKKIIREHTDGSRWVHTGDLGYMNQNGNLFVIGRMKRMIVSNGSKIYPVDIENAISRNPHISEVAVVGMDEEKNIKVPVAHIVFREPAKMHIETEINNMTEELRSAVPDFYLPWLWVVRKELPVTGVGKIDYRKLEKEKYELGKKAVIMLEGTY